MVHHFWYPQHNWSLLNHFWIGQGHCDACRKKWGFMDNELCVLELEFTRGHTLLTLKNLSELAILADTKNRTDKFWKTQDMLYNCECDLTEIGNRSLTNMYIPLQIVHNFSVVIWWAHILLCFALFADQTSQQHIASTFSRCLCHQLADNTRLLAYDNLINQKLRSSKESVI